MANAAQQHSMMQSTQPLFASRKNQDEADFNQVDKLASHRLITDKREDSTDFIDSKVYQRTSQNLAK